MHIDGAMRTGEAELGYRGHKEMRSQGEHEGDAIMTATRKTAAVGERGSARDMARELSVEPPDTRLMLSAGDEPVSVLAGPDLFEDGYAPHEASSFRKQAEPTTTRARAGQSVGRTGSRWLAADKPLRRVERELPPGPAVCEDRPVVSQRFEYKYLVSEAQAALVRSFASSYMSADRHTDAAYDNQYDIYSLYLDSPDLRLYRRSCNGEKNRFKLRVRYYDSRSETPVFVEVKARKSDCICKQRAAVPKESLDRVLGSYFLSARDMDVSSACDLNALERFCELGAGLSARPNVLIRYTREAYEDPFGGSLRITMDRHLACRRMQGHAVATDDFGWIDLPSEWVVLEIKFTNTFPKWVSEMVQALGLVRTSAAKYVRSVEALLNAGYGLTQKSRSG